MLFYIAKVCVILEKRFIFVLNLQIGKDLQQSSLFNTMISVLSDICLSMNL